jgi:arginine utilization protein RocB
MDTMLRIIAVPGISGTESENLVSNEIYDIISEIPYFKNNPSRLKKIKIQSDVLNRSFISALVSGKGKSNRTVIISGHFDVVGVEEYGHLKDIAFDPIEFTKRAKELPLDSEARHDLESGDWIFGRGTADMKFGIALCIEILREYSKDLCFNGNILFIGVPGEESNSEGMLGAVGHLRELQETQGLDYRAMLLAECYMADEAEEGTRLIHYGACGKIMPLFFFAGKETHASEPFDGINPDLLAAELQRLFELNTDFCSSDRGVVTPPPICLKLTDLKDIYSEQTPIYAAAYYNLVTLNLNSDIHIAKLKDMAQEAIDNTLVILEKRIEGYEGISGRMLPRNTAKPCVITYDELCERVKDSGGSDFDAMLDKKIGECRNMGLSSQEISENIIRETYERTKERVPMVIIAFAPPFYPDRYPSGKKAEALLEVVNKIIEFSYAKHGEVLKKVNYLMGICDISYTGLDKGEKIDEIALNMPGINKNYALPVDDLKNIDIPGIVLGGFGKDFHKYTERLNISYSFSVVPELYRFAIDRLLEE